MGKHRRVHDRGNRVHRSERRIRSSSNEGAEARRPMYRGFGLHGPEASEVQRSRIVRSMSPGWRLHGPREASLFRRCSGRRRASGAGADDDAGSSANAGPSCGLYVRRVRHRCRLCAWSGEAAVRDGTREMRRVHDGLGLRGWAILRARRQLWTAADRWRL